jgi:WD40 repeat protein
LILFDVDINSTRLKNTGTVEIYNTQTGGLIKSYSVPPGGIVYSFDNYPDDLYYVVDIDSPKRQIFHIN